MPSRKVERARERAANKDKARAKVDETQDTMVADEMPVEPDPAPAKKAAKKKSKKRAKK